MSEIFKDIVGYEGLYQISNHGNVLALERTVINKKGKAQRYPAKLLKFDLIQRSHTNYLRVTLCKNHSTKRFQVHRLVALHFVDNPFEKPHVNHIDNCGTNNHYSNLEWCTQAENLKHARETGLADWKKGHTKTYKSAETKKACLANLKDKTVLTTEQVLWARRNFISRHPEFGATALANKFGVTPTAMSNAIRGKTFKEIK